jgi:drug/metabolite transporter (DMT)-like permease
VPTERRSVNWRAYGALVVAVAGITWSAIFVRWAGVPGPASAFYRVLVAGAVLIPWRLVRRRPAPSPVEGPMSSRPASPELGRGAWVAVAGGVFFALDLALWNTAVLRTQAAVASILGNNTPFFVGMMSWLVLRRRPRASFWIGLALALAGCLTILSADLRRGTGSVSGDILALVASVFFAAYLMTTERVRTSMDTLTFSTLAIGGSIATLFVLCLVLRLPLSGYPPHAWLAIAGLGLVSQLMAYFALVYALGHLPATITSVGLLAQVPCTALLAMLLLGEPLTAVQMLGGVIVLAGIYVVNRDDG